MVTQTGKLCRFSGTDLIADCGDVDILLSVKGAVRHSADALLHVSSYLVHMELSKAGCGAAAIHLMCLHPHITCLVTALKTQTHSMIGVVSVLYAHSAAHLQQHGTAISAASLWHAGTKVFQIFKVL